jgi:hypothetical protein
VCAIDLRDFETLPIERACAELQPTCSRLVKDARTLVSDVMEHAERAESSDGDLESLGSPHLTFERAIDVAVQGSGASQRAIADIAFLVHLELRQRDERLARLTVNAGALSVLAECDSALRCIQKGFGAIDLAIARAEGCAAVLDFTSQLNESLRVRKAYGRFRNRVLALEHSEQPLYQRMRAMGTHIAMLVGWSEYPLLRVRDRLQLRELQQRILAWLLPEHREDELAGARVWQDVIAFIEMLAQVNRRQELMEHDAALLWALLAPLRSGGPMDETARERAQTLRGLDDELDRLLDGAVPSPAWQGCLERLAARHSGGAA